MRLFELLYFIGSTASKQVKKEIIKKADVLFQFFNTLRGFFSGDFCILCFFEILFRVLDGRAFRIECHMNNPPVGKYVRKINVPLALLNAGEMCHEEVSISIILGSTIGRGIMFQACGKRPAGPFKLTVDFGKKPFAIRFIPLNGARCFDHE